MEQASAMMALRRKPVRQTAVYLRLSLEDEREGESGSIRGQRLLVHQFLRRHKEFGESSPLEFCDDGYSGMNDDRPGYQDLLASIREGNIGCLIVKDFSRLGRNYIELGRLIEQTLPRHQVRLIAINDHYDSSIASGSDAGVAMKSLANHVYSVDISGKVRSAKRAQMNRGSFQPPYPVYGYLRDKDTRQYRVDPAAAEIVREIFVRYVGGDKVREIARSFNQRGVPTPGRYKALNNTGVRDWSRCKTAFWTDDTVRRILREERYTGVQIAGKRRRIIVGAAQTVAVPENEWAKTAGAHEAIISGELYRTAMERMKGAVNGTDRTFHPLAGKVKCRHCGRALMRKNGSYRCYTPIYSSHPGCGTCRMETAVLEHRMIELLNQLLRPYRAVLDKAAQYHRQSKLDMRKEHLECLQKEVSGIKQQKRLLYEKLKSGQILKEEFLQERQTLDSHYAERERQIADLEEQQSGLELPDSGLFRTMDSLERRVVIALVSEVRVTNSFRITVCWNFCHDTVRQTGYDVCSADQDTDFRYLDTNVTLEERIQALCRSFGSLDYN